jgi:P4 family phage/plasmid primase-like protien
MMIQIVATARLKVVTVRILHHVKSKPLAERNNGVAHGRLTTYLSAEDQYALMLWPHAHRIPIIPADTANKTISLKQWPTMDFGNIDFKTEMFKGKYDKGAAIRLGPTLQEDVYSVALDFDGWDAVIAWFGSWENVLLYSKKSLVEWHQNKGKIHVIIFTHEPLPNKKIHIGENNVLLEIRCEKQILFISPSPHKDGNKYTPLGTDYIETLDSRSGLLELKAKIDSFCDKYMSDADKNEYDEWLDFDTTILGEGAGRHDATKFKICSFFWKYTDEWLNLSDDERFERAWQWHLNHCKPPRTRGEFDRMCEWVKQHHKVKRDEEHQRIRDEINTVKQQADDYDDALINEYHIKTMVDNDELFYYNKHIGIFIDDAEYIVKRRLESDFGKKLSNKKVAEHLGHIRRRTYTLRNAFNPSTEWIACKNCMINLLTGETEPFSPIFMCTTQIPVIYDYGYATGQIPDFFRHVEGCRGRIIKFLYEIMGPEDVESILDYTAYCLWREYKFNFWLLLHGAGFNGKSILLSLIEAFLGKNNVSGETLDRLLHRPFSVVELYDKMANVDANVSADVILNNTGVLKKLTGNDLHIGEYKFKRPFKFVNHAKLIFSCNRIPTTEDQTDAFFRRLIIINLTTQFFGDKEDFDLIHKLTTLEQLTTLLHEILPRIPRILREGLKKTTNESIEENYDKYTKGSNPVKAFYEKALGPEPGGRVTNVDMLEHYRKFCRAFALTPESDQSFSRKLSDDFHLRKKQFRMNSDRVYCWQDVKLRDWDQEERDRITTLQDINDYSSETKQALR